MKRQCHIALLLANHEAEASGAQAIVSWHSAHWHFHNVARAKIGANSSSSSAFEKWPETPIFLPVAELGHAADVAVLVEV